MFDVPPHCGFSPSPPSPQGEGNARYPQGEDMEGGRWNGQARGKIDTFPSDADGFGGEVSIYIRPPIGFKSSALDLRQNIESSGPVKGIVHKKILC